MTTPAWPADAPTWITLEELGNDQNLDISQLSAQDTEALQRELIAAMVWVQDHRPDVDYHGPWTVPAYIQLGTIRLAARWFVRRVAPSGFMNMGDLGSATVPNVDFDIYMQLGIVGGFS